VRQSREGGAASRAPEDAITLRRVEVLRTYLELHDPARAVSRDAFPAGVRLVRRDPCSLEDYRRMYRDVGAQWYWHDRLEMSDAELAAVLALPNTQIWELEVDGRSAGYFELQSDNHGAVEIVYFGLVPEFMGRGLGRFLLNRAIETAAGMGANRVWLHTCTLDSERALPNYKARGFRAFRTQRLEVDLEGMQVVGERLLDD
jgi:GNAT superfamily N-acetyltransferase